MGSKRVVTEKDLKRKEKLKALAAISKPKKLSKKKKTLKVVNNEDITFEPEKKSSKLGGKKKRKEDSEIEEDITCEPVKKGSKLAGKKKRKEDSQIEEDITFEPEKKGSKLSGKKKRKEDSEIEDKSEGVPKRRKKDKSKKAEKKETKALLLSKSTSKPVLKRNESPADEVYRITSGDEDCSKGMKKWMTEYRQNRPGLKELQRKIDEFIVAHDKREDEAKKEREKATEIEGFTVVKHHKGRKKTTDSESGTAVGSVSQAAVLDKMAKKKSKEVGIDFYRFQRRDAQRNEIMMLQSKFEQDKKRVQQLRAARKFKPY
ncbi:hypothetical protein MKW94_017073 [Papaver nudicaule]|uniref:Ribosomal RNA-processing protein 7 C-terminal domain-containing protein n=1 Tax=Papaver nudicaule TaxID=74823 RepID=A0AA41UX72_PAPNU|nr:hypothetical protein [Papaver nudicaule]